MPEYQIINGGDTIKISALTPKVINRLLPKYNKIVLNDNLDKPLPKLPDSVTHLTLGSKYNQPLINLPPNLVELYCNNNPFVYDFNPTLENIRNYNQSNQSN